MKKSSLFVAVLLAALCAKAQQSSQPKSNDQPTQAQSASQSAQPQSDNAAQPQADKSAQPSDKNAASDKDAAKPQTGTAPAAAPVAPKGCLAVKPIGSHAFRNVMLLGVTGALISKQQYQVKDAVNYPATVGTKFHGDDLQTISSSGTKVVILDKHYKEEDLQKACH
jgi:cytoskeletal protein RodZ